MSLIPKEKYIDIMQSLPIFCVDIIIRNTKGEYLLVKRANEPKKGRWWIIGGRVLKGESMKTAAIRKIKEETGLQVKKLIPIGYFELINGTNPFGLPFKYHSLSVVFSSVINNRQSIVLDNQSSEFKFAKKLPADFVIRTFEAIKNTKLRN